MSRSAPTPLSVPGPQINLPPLTPQMAQYVLNAASAAPLQNMAHATELAVAIETLKVHFNAFFAAKESGNTDGPVSPPSKE